MSRTRNVPGWAKPAGIRLVRAQPKPMTPEERERQEFDMRPSYEKAAIVARRRKADPEAQAKQAQTEQWQEQLRKNTAERLEASKPVLTVDIVHEDGSPVIIDGQKVVGRVKAEHVAWAVDANAQWKSANHVTQ
jgi:hypothetical protein